MTKLKVNSKPGYKLTKLGWIPKDWMVKDLGEVVDFLDGKRKPIKEINRSKMKGQYPYYGASGIIDYVNDYIFDDELILLGEDGANIINRSTPLAFKVSGKIWVNNHAHVLKAKVGNDTGYISEYLESLKYNKYNTGTAQPKLNKEVCNKILILCPEFIEQTAISVCLSTWDKSIQELTQLIEQKELYKKWFMKQLLSGKIRFSELAISDKRKKTKVGEIPQDWDVLPISKVVKRIKESFTPKPTTIYREIGIRSHTKGIFYKESVTGKSLGNKAVFWIQPDCFIVNIVFAWEHAIAKTTENEKGMIASHRFPMYKPIEGIIDLDYLLYFFKSTRGKHLLGLASPGGAGRNKTLGQQEFMKLKIPVPSIDEQNAIVKVLLTADDELMLLRNKLELLKEQKKGMMQQLLTGKKRLRVNNELTESHK